MILCARNGDPKLIIYFLNQKINEFLIVTVDPWITILTIFEKIVVVIVYQCLTELGRFPNS